MAEVASGDAFSTPGLLLIEHLNLNVMRRDVATAFNEALGAVLVPNRKPTATLHTNCGALTQFHMPSPETEANVAEPQVWRGSIEMIYKDSAQLSQALERLEKLKEDERFKGTHFSVSRSGEDSAMVVGPYGNRFTLSLASELDVELFAPPSGGRPGSEGSQVLGFKTLSLQVPRGASAPAAKFYSEVLGFKSQQIATDQWALLGGPGEAQALVLEEADVDGKEVGEHMAIYIGDYTGCFQRLDKLGLIWVNPRFLYLDKSTTVEEALHYKTFRFKDIVDLETGRKLFELEHEVRTPMHPAYPFPNTTAKF